MPQPSQRPSLLRERTPQGHHRVTTVELFFDLVFVFAVTQISHTLLGRFTPLGFLQTSLLMLAVWWVWVYTAWVTNWLDPDRATVRIMLFGLMLGGLVLSTSIPKAFDSRGLAFGVAFAAMQVGRSVFFLWAVRRADQMLWNNFLRILVWLSVSGVFWLAGGAASDPALRLVLWGIALAIEYIGPFARFWIPKHGASAIEDWSVEGGHMAERCAGFIIIALGESIVVTGATFADTDWTSSSISAFLVALLGSIAMWWIYFHKGAEAGSDHISNVDDPGRLARLAYTYLHLPIVAGIVLSAVGDEMLLKHPDGQVGASAVIGMVGGPLLFLIGVILFKQSIRGHLQPSHIGGIVALVALLPFAGGFSPLALSSATTLIMIAVAAWEAISLRSGAVSAGAEALDP